MKIRNSISTCIIFFPFIIASAMEENNIKKNESNYQEKKICFEIKVSSNVEKEDILNNAFWTDKIEKENYTLKLKKIEIDYKSLERYIKKFKDFYGKSYTEAEMNNYVEKLKKKNQISTYSVEINKDSLDKLNPEEGFCYMFLWCVDIIEINGIEKIINGRNIKSLEGMFYGCSSLISIKSDFVWEIESVENLFEMFNGCTQLINLPTNMASWNVKNVKTMKKLFYNCNALKNIPDILKWDTSNYTDLS